MIKPNDPRELAETLLNRSVCSVQVAACVEDKWGVFAWGVNHAGFDGFGEHAERACIRRANKRRLRGATMYVATKRKRNGKILNSKPCPDCQKLLNKYGIVAVYTVGAVDTCGTVWEREYPR